MFVYTNKFMRLKLFLGTLLIGFLSGFSQELQITGSITDASRQPIPFANIILETLDGSQPTTGTVSDDQGMFSFNDLIAAMYRIEIRYLGFKTKSLDLNLTQSTALGSIILIEDTQELDGVTVMAKRPTINRLVDRLVFNVENSTLSNNNVLDVLKHTPGVFVNDGNISIKQAIPTFYINDRRVHLSVNEIQRLLEGTTATNLKSIEVITNPPAKYEAEGGAIINIVMSKNIIAGYNGSVFGNFKQGYQYPKYSLGTSHFFKGKKLNAYLNFSDSPQKEFRNNKERINFFSDQGDLATSWETDYKRTRKTSDKSINTNINYELDKHNNLGLSTNMLIAPRESTKTFVNSTTDVFDSNKLLDSTFVTDNRLVDETYNLAFTLDYEHKFNKEGEKLSISTHHTNYDFSSFQNVDTDYLFPDNTLIRNNRFQTFSSQLIQLYTGQLDYEFPGTSFQFETGVKVSNINSKSILTQYVFNDNTKEIDEDNSDTFLYDETNYSAYASFSKDWDKWILKTGLRAEYTDTRGQSLSANQINSNDYLKVFPSIHILNRINDKNELYFNYKKRIYRPRYSQLNPFKYFLNDNAFVTGDPNLRPQIDDVLTLGYTFNKDFTFELYYRYENNPTLQVVFQDNENNLIKYSNTNIDRSITYGLDFTTYTKLDKRWNLYLLSSIFFYDNQFFAIESNNQLYNNKKWSLYANVINYFNLLTDKSLDLEVSFLYISSVYDGPKALSAISGLNLNLRKSILQNKVALSIGVQDAFNSLNVSSTTRYLNQDLFYKSSEENRLFTFGFIYKFGNFNLRTNNKGIDLEERERLNR